MAVQHGYIEDIRTRVAVARLGHRRLFWEQNMKLIPTLIDYVTRHLTLLLIFGHGTRNDQVARQFRFRNARWARQGIVLQIASAAYTNSIRLRPDNQT